MILAANSTNKFQLRTTAICLLMLLKYSLANEVFCVPKIWD